MDDFGSSPNTSTSYKFNRKDVIKMNTKVSRYQLLFDDERNELKFKQFNEVMFQLQKEMVQIANREVQILWEDMNWSNDVKTQTGSYPTKEEVLEHYSCPVMTYIYRSVPQEYNYTGNISVLQRNVNKRFMQNRKGVIQGKRSIDSYKSTLPIAIHGNSIKIKKSGNKYLVSLSLLSNSYRKQLGIKKNQITFELMFGKSWSSRQIVDSILSGEFSHTASSVICKNRKWFLNLGYSAPDKDSIKFIEGRTMGIDLGIVKPVVMAFNDNPVHFEVDSNEISELRKQMIARRASIGKQTKHCANSKIGHGVHKRIEGIERLKTTESNFRDRINHQYSRYIVDMAVKYKCKTIQMEDLSGISKDSTFLKSWPYFDLQTKIEYKAKENGIDVIKINPKFTSQRCSKCGYISEANRPEQAIFQCKKCGFGINADWNAALNIATPNIEEIIKNSDIE